ncbi:hypothetical protein EDM68_01840 [Candidatus Uhrbacteria bacterium]|nr:MAG: hypothetical protein EDM68_01840 [Candidatus Uhrbacteria bacterium]
MDVAEATRRALGDHLREAFAKPGAGKPHRIFIPLCDTLWSHVQPSIVALGAAPDPAKRHSFKGEIEVDPGTRRLIRFRFYGHRRILVAHCLK